MAAFKNKNNGTWYVQFRYLIAYAWHPASNAWELVEHAKRRAKKDALVITLIKPDD